MQHLFELLVWYRNRYTFENAGKREYSNCVCDLLVSPWNNLRSFRINIKCGLSDKLPSLTLNTHFLSPSCYPRLKENYHWLSSLRELSRLRVVRCVLVSSPNSTQYFFVLDHFQPEPNCVSPICHHCSLTFAYVDGLCKLADEIKSLVLF